MSQLKRRDISVITVEWSLTATLNNDTPYLNSSYYVGRHTALVSLCLKYFPSSTVVYSAVEWLCFLSSPWWRPLCSRRRYAPICSSTYFWIRVKSVSRVLSASAAGGVWITGSCMLQSPDGSQIGRHANYSVSVKIRWIGRDLQGSYLGLFQKQTKTTVQVWQLCTSRGSIQVPPNSKSENLTHWLALRLVGVCRQNLKFILYQAMTFIECRIFR